MPPQGSIKLPPMPIPTNPQQDIGRSISTFVERVQENLAIFSMPDNAIDYLQQSNRSAVQYEPKSLVFEFLVNDRSTGSLDPNRQFEMHVSERLMQKAHQCPENVIRDLRRLYINAQALSLEWENVRWDSPVADKFGLSELDEDMKRLHEIHQQSLNSTLPDQELETTSRILQKLLKRWEIEPIPTNFSATALIYEAWKLGNFLPLSRFDASDPEHIRLLRGLFIAHTQDRTTHLLTQMPADLGLPHLKNIDHDYLSNRRLWTRQLFCEPNYPQHGKKWFACVEHSLIHKSLIQQTKPSDRYLIHYPLILDDYWFAGLAYIYAEWDDFQFAETPELFNRRKYLKFYKVIQTIADALKVSRKRDALLWASALVQQGTTNQEAFRQALQDYFVCLHILPESAELADHSNTIRNQMIYHRHGVKIYGPNWMNDAHQKRLRDEIDGDCEFYGMKLAGLYEEVEKVCTSLRAIRLEGQNEQSRQIAHQSAGLLAEVWCDPAKDELHSQALGCLWHLKSLIEVWGNFDLQPTQSITDGIDADFPHWKHLNDREILEHLMSFGLSHALRRATYRRPDSSEFDQQVRRAALQIISTENSISQFQDYIGIEFDSQTIPSWVRYRGFALCFHHCFWQAAYHAFRAATEQHSEQSQSPCLSIQTSYQSVLISNRMISTASAFHTPRDWEFYEKLQDRMRQVFQISPPELWENSDQFQIAISLGA